MEGSAAVAYHGSMGDMPISRTRFEGWVIFRKKNPNYHPEKYAGPTIGKAVSWGRGGQILGGGGLYESTHTKNMEI